MKKRIDNIDVECALRKCDIDYSNRGDYMIYHINDNEFNKLAKFLNDEIKDILECVDRYEFVVKQLEEEISENIVYREFFKLYKSKNV